MSEQLLTILKVCLLVLLYLFFLRVLRAVWAEIRGPKLVEPSRRRVRKAKQRGPGPPQPAVGAHLAVVEPAELRGRTYSLAGELTVGRAAGCQVTLDDTYASQVHARVFSREGQHFVEDLGSTNGTYLNRRKVQGPMVMRRGDRLQVGNTVMEMVS